MQVDLPAASDMRDEIIGPTVHQPVARQGGRHYAVRRRTSPGRKVLAMTGRLSVASAAASTHAGTSGSQSQMLPRVSRAQLKACTPLKPRRNKSVSSITSTP